MTDVDTYRFAPLRPRYGPLIVLIRQPVERVWRWQFMSVVESAERVQEPSGRFELSAPLDFSFFLDSRGSAFLIRSRSSRDKTRLAWTLACQTARITGWALS